MPYWKYTQFWVLFLGGVCVCVCVSTREQIPESVRPEKMEGTKKKTLGQSDVMVGKAPSKISWKTLVATRKNLPPNPPVFFFNSSSSFFWKNSTWKCRLNNQIGTAQIERARKGRQFLLLLMISPSDGHFYYLFSSLFFAGGKFVESAGVGQVAMAWRSCYWGDPLSFDRFFFFLVSASLISKFHCHFVSVIRFRSSPSFCWFGSSFEFVPFFFSFFGRFAFVDSRGRH